MSCPATGIRDFPIQNNVSVTETLNSSIFEPSALEIQWAKRGTVPSFNQNYFTEGILDSASQATTLRLRGNTYTLKVVKIAEPQNRTLLTPADRALCLGEIVMIFSSSTALVEKYVFLCIPILNKTSSPVSPYLTSIAQGRLPGRQIGLDDLLPKSKKYTSYTTCLRQVQAGQTTTVQANILVFTGGLDYSSDALNQVIRKMGQAFQGKPIPLGALVDGLVAKTEASLFLLANEGDYKNYLRTSELSVTSSQSSGSSNRRLDSTDSYKCVPLKPDTDVKNNRILIDTDEGVPLSQVLKEKSDDQGEGKITPGMVERMIAVVLGTAAGLFILSVIAYIFSRVTTENADDNFPWLMAKTKDLLPMVFVSMVVGIVGFLIGFFTSTK